MVSSRRWTNAHSSDYHIHWRGSPFVKMSVSHCAHSQIYVIYIIHLEIISMGVNVCWVVVCKWEKAFFDVFCYDPKQMELMFFFLFSVLTSSFLTLFNSCYYFHLEACLYLINTIIWEIWSTTTGDDSIWYEARTYCGTVQTLRALVSCLLAVCILTKWTCFSNLSNELKFNT